MDALHCNGCFNLQALRCTLRSASPRLVAGYYGHHHAVDPHLKLARLVLLLHGNRHGRFLSHVVVVEPVNRQ